jgi:hypothetical protein
LPASALLAGKNAPWTTVTLFLTAVLEGPPG